MVTGVDASAGTVQLDTSALGANKNVTVTLAKTTVLRRYAPGSVNFDDAAAALIDQIKVGDQLRARGSRIADGNTLAADEVVSGSFRNIAGTVIAIDAANGTITVTDLAHQKSPCRLRSTMLIAIEEVAAADGAAHRRSFERHSSGNVAGRCWRPSNIPVRAWIWLCSLRRPESASRVAGTRGANGSNGVRRLRRPPGPRRATFATSHCAHARRNSGRLQKGDAVIIVATSGSQELSSPPRLRFWQASSPSSRPRRIAANRS